MDGKIGAFIWTDNIEVYYTFLSFMSTDIFKFPLLTRDMQISYGTETIDVVSYFEIVYAVFDQEIVQRGIF